MKPHLDSRSLRLLTEVISRSALPEHGAELLALWYAFPEDAAKLRAIHTSLAPEVHAIYGLRDRDDRSVGPHGGSAVHRPGDGDLEHAKALGFSLIGPSIRLPDPVLASIGGKYGLESFAWTVDTEDDLRKAAAVGLLYVVSNNLWHMQAVRQRLLQECEESSSTADQV
eukprot:UN2127